MKKLLIGLLALSSITSHAGDDCRETFSKYKKKHLYESISSDAYLGTAVYGGLAVGGIVEATGNFGTTAALGSTLSISSAFAPAIIILGIEGGIALANSPYTKAINLIDQSYKYRTSNNFKNTKLLKRIARKLDVTPEDLAETIIQGNEDGSLCLNNKSKKDIMDSIKSGDTQIIDVDESDYSGNLATWSCNAYKNGVSFSGSGSTKRKAKRNAKKSCSEKTGENCKEISICKNYETRTQIVYGSWTEISSF